MRLVHEGWADYEANFPKSEADYHIDDDAKTCVAVNDDGKLVCGFVYRIDKRCGHVVLYHMDLPGNAYTPSTEEQLTAVYQLVGYVGDQISDILIIDRSDKLPERLFHSLLASGFDRINGNYPALVREIG